MIHNRYVNTIIRRVLLAVIALFFLILMLGQVLVPIAAREMVSEYPEVAHLAGPYSSLGIAALACFQLALLCLGVVLARSATPRFWKRATRALLIVTGVLCVAGFGIIAGVASHLLATMHAGGLPVVLGLAVALVGAVGFACVTYISVHAFDSTRAEHQELEAVI